MAKQRRQNVQATAVYARVSTAVQAEEGTSLGTQEEACRAFARDHALPPVSEMHVYREVYSGAELFDRPRLTALREAIRRGEVSTLVCYAIDRLSRDPVHLGVILSEADHHGVAVQFVTEPLDASMEGELIRFVRGYAAKVEREKIKERTMRGKRERLRQGKPAGYGMDLYGYRRDRDHDVWRVYEPEAAIVREIFALAAEGVSVRAIAAALNRRGVPSPSVGKRRPVRDEPPRWGKSQVTRLLHHPMYKGVVIAWRWQSRGRYRNPVLRPASEWITLPDGVAPAIVGAPLWEQVQRALATNTGAETRNALHPYLLRGHVVCAVCGRRMQTDASKGARYYRCPSRTLPVGACGARMVNADAVEAAIWGDMERILLDERLFRRHLAMPADGPDPALAVERDQAAREMARIAAQQARLVERFGQGAEGFPWELVEAQITRLQGELAAWQQRQAAIAARIAAATPVLMPDIAAVRARAARNLAHFTFEDKRLALRVFGVRVVANGKQWRVSLAPGR